MIWQKEGIWPPQVFLKFPIDVVVYAKEHVEAASRLLWTLLVLRILV